MLDKRQRLDNVIILGYDKVDNITILRCDNVVTKVTILGWQCCDNITILGCDNVILGCNNVVTILGCDNVVTILLY